VREGQATAGGLRDLFLVGKTAIWLIFTSHFELFGSK
jgi:hypothetical protein